MFFWEHLNQNYYAGFKMKNKLLMTTFLAFGLFSWSSCAVFAEEGEVSPRHGHSSKHNHAPDAGGSGAANAEEDGQSSDHCKKVRAVIDLGSGGTKADRMTVDSCAEKLGSNIGKSINKTVQYSVAMGNSGTDRLPEDIKDTGIAAIAGITEELSAGDQKPEKIAGVATEAMRRAKDGCAFLARIKKETDVTIKRIDQSMEGILGYVAAFGHQGVDKTWFANNEGGEVKGYKHDKAVVWDIGGGSLQLTFFKEPSERYKKQAKTDPHNYVVYGGAVASGTFRSMVTSMLEGGGHNQGINSPNPINAEFGNQLSKIAYQIGVHIVPDEIKKAIKDADGQVIAIGAVHNRSIANAIYKTSKVDVAKRGYYTLKDLKKAARALQDKNDNEIEEILGLPSNQDLGPTQLTNLILVYAVMKKAGIKKVWLVDANTGKGAFLWDDLWSDGKSNVCSSEEHVGEFDMFFEDVHSPNDSNSKLKQNQLSLAQKENKRRNQRYSPGLMDMVGAHNTDQTDQPANGTSQRIKKITRKPNNKTEMSDD